MESGAKLGVSELSVGGLDLKYASISPWQTVGEVPALEPKTVLPPEPDHDANNEEYLAQEELRVRQEQLGLLLIEDPMEFERQICAGELDLNEGSDGSDEEA